MSNHLPERQPGFYYDDYIHELTERFAAAPLLAHVETMQRHNMTRYYRKSELPREAAKAQALLDGFRAEAREQNLLGQLVSLEGDSVRVPSLKVGLNDGQYMVTHAAAPELSPETLSQYHAYKEVKGMFEGFGIIFTEIQANSELCIAQFVYQISTSAPAPTPHGPVPLFITGVVGQAQLNFLEDQRHDTIVESASALYGLVPDAQSSISLIVEAAMTKHHEDGSLFRHLGHHAESIVAAADVDKRRIVEDQVAQLIASTFVEDQSIEILTDVYIRQFDDATRSSERSHTGEDLSMINGTLREVIFLDDHNSAQYTPIQPRTSCTMVVGRPGEVVFVPMVHISEYERR